MRVSSPRVLAVIPARAGSKGIPRKNMRLIAGKPLIAYAIENAMASVYIDSVVVSSDSEEVLAFASQYPGVIPLRRESALAHDALPLDPVIHDAVRRREDAEGIAYDVVVTLQPTSPLLTVHTLDSALVSFLNSGKDALISAVNRPHLSWRLSGAQVVPAYDARKNRQELPPNYLETGAFLISRRECVSERGRLGTDVGIYEVPDIEATDIDTAQDWVVCEAFLLRKTIVFRADGYRELGLGHIYRVLTLAYEFIEHDIWFICNTAAREGIEKLRGANMRVVEVSDDAELLAWLESNRPEIYIHDCLDTNRELIRAIKRLVGRVVTFEDLGEGASEADAVVNEIYEGAVPNRNVYSGKAYVCLRDEFLITKPKPFSESVRRVVVMFGGTDPLNLSARVYALAKRYNKGGIRLHFDFILGPGYSDNSVVPDSLLGIQVIRDAIRVSDYMKEADLAFSSQGRTTFELASMGVPTVVLAQNEREQLHRFAQMDNGFINLGLGGEVSDEDVAAAFDWLVGAVTVRREMRRLMLRNDLRSGIVRVKRIILGEAL